MRAFALPIAVGLLFSARVFCADYSGAFPDLAKIELGDERVRVWYPKDHAKEIATPPAWHKDYEEAGVYAAAPLVLELGHGLPPLALACDSGPSNDPSCRLLTNRDDPATALFESPGTDFAFLPNGEIHASGATDYAYDHRRVFRYDGKRFAEIAQPFRYVGVDGRTTAPLELTAERGAGKKRAARPIVTLPADTPLTILLNAASGDDENGQNADYLVKTREGLVGWARIPTKSDGTTIVEGLRFNGD
ncbi:MAG: hypothetical protein ABW186_04055 [Rhodanobacteraceae bacterium]